MPESVKIVCNHCGSDVRLVSSATDECDVACGCISIGSLLASDSSLPDEWYRFDDAGANPWPSDEYRDDADTGERQNSEDPDG